jgi:hypothetical protein
MTTALSVAESGAMARAGALRIPLIIADLMPLEVVEARRGRRVRWIVLAALVVVAGLLGGWYGVEHRWTGVARTGLTEAEDSARALESQKTSYQAVVGVQGQSAQITKQLAGLMARDMQWSTVVRAVQAAVPVGITLHGLSSSTDVSGTGAATGSAGAPTTSSIGELTVVGSGTSKAAVAAYVDALNRVAGVADPLLASANEQKGVVDFTVHMKLTSAALGGRYSSGSGGN